MHAQWTYGSLIVLRLEVTLTDGIGELHLGVRTENICDMAHTGASVLNSDFPNEFDNLKQLFDL